MSGNLKLFIIMQAWIQNPIHIPRMIGLSTTYSQIESQLLHIMTD